jgi:very-short-patch-repair endonuclease
LTTVFGLPGPAVGEKAGGVKSGRVRALVGVERDESEWGGGAPDAPERRRGRRGIGASQTPKSGCSRAFTVNVLGRRSAVPVSGSTDARIATIAGLQRGRVNRRQLLAAGIGPGAVSRRLAGGRLLLVARGVYAVGHAAPGPGTPETEALLALRPGVTLSHDSALALWGLRPPPPVVHVTVVGSAAGRAPGGVVHRASELPARDLRVREGLPVTSPSRALYELAAQIGGRELERAVEEAIRRGLTSERELQAQISIDNVNRSARRRVARLLAGREEATFTRSEAEERFLSLVREACLPAPMVNVRRHGYEIDFLWPAAGLAVEVDGFAFHSGPDAFARDRRRDATLLAAGIVVTRVTWGDLTAGAMATIVRIAQMLERLGR